MTRTAIMVLRGLFEAAMDFYKEGLQPYIDTMAGMSDHIEDEIKIGGEDGFTEFYDLYDFVEEMLENSVILDDQEYSERPLTDEEAEDYIKSWRIVKVQ